MSKHVKLVITLVIMCFFMLQKIYNLFYTIASPRSEGTIPNLKGDIKRDNVNGHVKENQAYEAHKDFAMIVLR